MPDPPTVAVRPGSHRLFLKKAREFARTMESALAQKQLNAAASAASHVVISAADAVLAKEKGVRSRARDHSAVTALIAALHLPGARERAFQVEEVLSLKHVAEYDDREVTPAEAARAVKKAKRFLDWAEACLKE